MIFPFGKKPIVHHRSVTLEQLEERIVLDAAGADSDPQENQQDTSDNTQKQVEGGESAQPPGTAATASNVSQASDPLGDIFNQDLSVVLISNALDKVEALSDAAVDGSKVIVYDASQDDLGDIVATLSELVDSNAQEIGQLAILSHGAKGALSLGNGEFWTVETLQTDSSAWIALGGLLADDARIDLYGCSIGVGEDGVLLVETLAGITGAIVWASDDPTGNVPSADWDLEEKTNESARGYLIDGSLLADADVSLAIVSPIANGQNVLPNPQEDIDHIITVTGNDGKEPDLNDVTFDVVSGPAHGTLTAGAKGGDTSGNYSQQYTFDPALNYHGADSFQFTMTTPYAGLWKGFSSAAGDIGIDTDVTRSIQFGDMDNDGDLDIVVGNYGQTNKLYTNNGSGEFSYALDIVDVTSPELRTHSIQLGDWDNDGDLDVVAANEAGEIKLYRNHFTESGTLSFGTAADVLVHSTDARSIQLGDVDNDGNLDLVVGNYGQRNQVYKRNPGLPEDIGLEGDQTCSIQLGDVDNDGDLDLIAGNFERRNQLFRNNGSGAFSFAGYIGDDGNRTNSIQLGDVDNDGDLDVIAGNEYQTNMVYIRPDTETSNVATVTMTVDPVNDAPDAVDDSDTTDEDTPVTIDVLDNDSDVDGDGLILASVTDGSNGTVTNNGTSVTYTPDPDFNGSDSFTYTISDGNGGSDTATVNVTVISVNDAPDAVDDSATTDEDTAVTIDVLDNDSDVDGDGLILAGVTDGSHGTVTNNGSSVTYTPDPDFNGLDSFTYTISDGNGGSDTVTVNVRVNAVNDAPVTSAPISITLFEDTSVAATGVSITDVDVYEGTGQIQVRLFGGHGTITLAQTTGLAFTPGSSNGSSDMTFTGLLDDVNDALATLTYSPDPNYYGSDTITILVNDQGNYAVGNPILGDDATIDVKVISVPEFDEIGKPYLDAPSKLNQGPFSGPFSTAGTMPAVGNLLENLTSLGLIPSSLIEARQTDIGSSLPAMSQLEILVHEALFGRDEESRNQAWSSLESFLAGKKSEEHVEWVGLEEFCRRLREWRIDKTLDEILLVFNAKQVKLGEWFQQLMSSGDDVLGAQQKSAWEPEKSLPQSFSPKALVFDMKDLRAADLLYHDVRNHWPFGSSEGLSRSNGFVCKVFDLDSLTFADAFTKDIRRHTPGFYGQ
jgi:hypothetical protein